MTSLTLYDCSFDCSHDDCYYTFKKIVNSPSGKLKVYGIMTNSVQDDLALFPIFFAPSSLSHLYIRIHNMESVQSLSLIDLTTNTNLTHVYSASF